MDKKESRRLRTVEYASRSSELYTMKYYAIPGSELSFYMLCGNVGGAILECTAKLLMEFSA